MSNPTPEQRLIRVDPDNPDWIFVPMQFVDELSALDDDAVLAEIDEDLAKLNEEA